MNPRQFMKRLFTLLIVLSAALLTSADDDWHFISPKPQPPKKDMCVCDDKKDSDALDPEAELVCEENSAGYYIANYNRDIEYDPESHRKLKYTFSAQAPDGSSPSMTYEYTINYKKDECCPGCSSTGGQPPAHGSIKWSLSLGRDTTEEIAGWINLITNYPSLELATPVCLDVSTSSENVEEIMDNESTNALRQVYAPECLSDIVTINDFKYEMRFYRPEDVEDELDTNGYYQVKEGSSPFITWIVENPEASTNDYDTLKITKDEDGEETVYQYEWTEVTNGVGDWALNSAGLKLETGSVTTNGDETTKTYCIKETSGTVVSKREKTMRAYDWGNVFVRSVNDPDGANLTTTRGYYDDEGETNKYGKVAIETNPDGSWTRYDDYDDRGRRTEVVYCWQDTATNATAANSKTVYFDYEPLDANDTLTVNVYTNVITNGMDVVTNMTTNSWLNYETFKPRTKTEKILDETVAKTYYAYYDNAGNEAVEIEEKCSDASNSYGDSSNLRTTRIYNDEDSSDAGSEKIKSIEYSDGRLDTYTYEWGTYNTNADPSQCSFTVEDADDIRITITHGTTNSPDGIEYKTTQETQITDQFGRTYMQETYVYNGADYDRIAWTVNYLDEDGHVIAVFKSDNTESEATWGCCGKESEIDQNGTEYNYTYDALKRVTQRVKDGYSGEYASQVDIYTTYTYDAAGRRLTETTTASGLTNSTTRQYDLAGRVTNSVDANGRTTTTAYSNGGRTVTVTQADGTTRITDRYKDGKTKSITGTGVIPQYYEYGVNGDGTQWTTVYTGATNSAVWAKTTTDLLGKVVKTEKPGYSGTETVQNHYNDLGQLYKTTRTGSADTLYEYDELGNQFRSGLDINDNGSLDLASMDRISESETSFTYDGSAWWQQTISRIYATDSSAACVTNSITKQKLTGLGSGIISETRTTDIHGNETIQTVSVDRDNKKVTRTVDTPLSSEDQESISANGLLVSSTSRSGNTTTFSYDALGRRTGTTDPRIGESVTHYDSNGYVDYVEDPAGNRTSYTYDSMGRTISKMDSLSNMSYSSYSSHSQLTHTWGSAKYPVQYEYDSYGRMTKMHTYRSGTGWDQSTWPASPGDSDETTWAYHEASGLLTSKTDDAGEAVTYTYGNGGRLATRTWARTSGTNAIVTTYSYDSDTGEMTGIDYSDDTPDITFSYDRMGRQVTITDAVGTRTFAYNSALQLSTETIVSTAGATNLLTRSYDAQGRSSGFSLDSGYQVEYSYDTYGRMNVVSGMVGVASALRADYSYLANSDLIASRTTDSGLQSTVSYEAQRNLISSIENKFDATTISKYTYANDAGGRRTSVKTTGTAFMTVGDMFNLYNYNTRSELIGANRYFGDDLEDTGDPVGLQSFGYAYDNIGNRTSVTNNGDVTSYSPNNLNQYTQRQISNLINLRGSAETGATVTVKMGSSQSESVTRQNKYWHKQLTSTNDTEAQYPLIKVVGVAKNAATNGDDIVTIETGHVFVAKTPEEFTYDEDGNLLSDGRWTYSWNGENRLVAMETSTNVPASVPVTRLEFVYDYQGRRVSKSVSQWVSNQWDESSSSTFVYDSWNLISETTVNRELGTTNVSSYTWGLDLSGSLQGAGGIGGLLFRSDGGTSSVSSVSYTFDANGNVSELLTDTGEIAAHYEYDPYGNTLVSEGDLASDNVYRFSTKYTDAETKLLYYGFRYYSPGLGRWPSRDPIGEEGGVNLYCIVLNSSINEYDLLGRKSGSDSGSKSKTIKYGGWGFSYKVFFSYDCGCSVKLKDVTVNGWNRLTLLIAGYSITVNSSNLDASSWSWADCCWTVDYSFVSKLEVTLLDIGKIFKGATWSDSVDLGKTGVKLCW